MSNAEIYLIVITIIFFSPIFLCFFLIPLIFYKLIKIYSFSSTKSNLMHKIPFFALVDFNLGSIPFFLFSTFRLCFFNFSYKKIETKVKILINYNALINEGNENITKITKSYVRLSTVYLLIFNIYFWVTLVISIMIITLSSILY